MVSENGCGQKYLDIRGSNRRMKKTAHIGASYTCSKSRKMRWGAYGIHVSRTCPSSRVATWGIKTEGLEETHFLLT
jgi:hypothetical protein